MQRVILAENAKRKIWLKEDFNYQGVDFMYMGYGKQDDQPYLKDYEVCFAYSESIYISKEMAIRAIDIIPNFEGGIFKLLEAVK